MQKYVNRFRSGNFSLLLSRLWSGSANDNPLNYTETDLQRALHKRFPKAQEVVVTDVSGGCGAMYEIYVKSEEFKGLNTIKQHRLITETLKEQIKNMHGLRIHTEAVK